MKKDKATKLPWFCKPLELHQDELGEVNGIEIINSSLETVADNQTYYPHAITKANAKLIVKAVNNHARLLNACKDALATLEGDCGTDTTPTINSLEDVIKQVGSE